jgi:hypothetical protein
MTSGNDGITAGATRDPTWIQVEPSVWLGAVGADDEIVMARRDSSIAKHRWATLLEV